MTVDDKLRAAEEKAQRAQRYRDKLIVIKTAEAEIPGIWDTGQVPMSKLAENYGISPMTVRRILQDSGREIHRFRKLNDEERAEIIAHLKHGENTDQIAAAYQVSRATIRRIGVEGGVIVKGVRKARRSDEEYALILAFDAEARARFGGAGLYNLGLGLRQWQSKQKAMAKVLAEAKTEAPAEPQPAPPPPLPTPEPAPQSAQEDAPPAVVFGDGEEDAAAVVGPFASQADQKPGFNF